MLSFVITFSFSVLGAVILAYTLSSNSSRLQLNSDKMSELTEIMFPHSVKLWSKFEGIAKKRAKAHINPMKYGKMLKMRQFKRISRILVKAQQGQKSRWKIFLSMKLVFSLIPNSTMYARKKKRQLIKLHRQLFALEKGRMSAQYVELICSLADVTFATTALRFLDPTYTRVPAMDHYAERFTTMIDAEVSFKQ